MPIIIEANEKIQLQFDPENQDFVDRYSEYHYMQTL